MGFWDVVEGGARMAQGKLAEQEEKMNKTMFDASRLNDKALVQRWYRCHDALKKAVYAKEMQNRGLTAEDIRKYTNFR